MTSKHISWVAVLAGFVAAACTNVPKTSSPVDMRFELVNAGRSSVWFGPEYPVEILHEGETYVPLRSCGCGEQECQGAPADFAPSPSRTEYRPGSDWSAAWDGGVLGSDCPDLHDAVGEEVVARFCWWTNIEGTDEFTGQVAGEKCADVPFRLGRDEVVRHEIDSTVEWDGSTVPIVLQNDTDASLYIQKSDSCGESTFFNVAFGDDRVYPGGDLCLICDCSDGPDCEMICTEECPAPLIVEVAPGAEHSAAMPLIYSRRYDTTDGVCTQVQHVPVGPLTASICYGTGVDGDLEFGQITDTECQQVEFFTRDAEARLVVDSVN